MLPPASLADTDILSELMRRHPAVIARARAYLSAHGKLVFSEISRFEILRGLLDTPRAGRRETFEALCQNSVLLPVDAEAVERAAEIHARLKAAGSPIGDADCLIAGTALARNMTLVTNNTRHFSRITGLRLDNWKLPAP